MALYLKKKIKPKWWNPVDTSASKVGGLSPCEFNSHLWQMGNIKKKCSKCNGVLDTDDFHDNRAKKDGLSNYCKKCNQEYLKEHYILNQEYYKQKSTNRRATIKEWYKEYKSNLKCKKCGENHPACLEFHHEDSSTKDKEISKMVHNSVSPDKILKETLKCTVLCSNCHRKLHYDQHTL